VLNLTKKQQAVLDFIADQMREGKPCPSRREIAEQFGFASPFAASCHIDALVSKGALIREAGKARSLKPATTLRGRPTVEVRIFGSIPAGHGEDREAEDEGCIAVDLDALQIKPTDRTFGLRVRGDSMTGVGILDGDLVLLEHGAEPRPGQVVAALIDGKSTLKTFLVHKGKPFLRAENPRYPDLIPVGELMVQGVMRALIRKAK
jgi:repressor LexA